MLENKGRYVKRKSVDQRAGSGEQTIEDEGKDGKEARE
jgi:hypothetical protein